MGYYHHLKAPTTTRMMDLPVIIPIIKTFAMSRNAPSERRFWTPPSTLDLWRPVARDRFMSAVTRVLCL